MSSSVEDSHVHRCFSCVSLCGTSRLTLGLQPVRYAWKRIGFAACRSLLTCLSCLSIVAPEPEFRFSDATILRCTPLSLLSADRLLLHEPPVHLHWLAAPAGGEASWNFVWEPVGRFHVQGACDLAGRI